MGSIWHDDLHSALQKGGSVDQVQELRIGEVGLGAIFSDVYKAKRATTRELFGKMKNQLGWQQEHHLANGFSWQDTGSFEICLWC